jgi:hypothetical protein
MVREIDTKWWSIRTPSPPPLRLADRPSPSPWKGEGVRQRGASINQTERCAIAMHIARGAQTGFVILIIPYGPRDRHKTLIGGAQSRFELLMPLPMLLLLSLPRINETERCAIAMHIARGVQTGFVILIIPYGPRDRHKTVVGAYKPDLRFRCFLQSIIGAIEIA